MRKKKPSSIKENNYNSKRRINISPRNSLIFSSSSRIPFVIDNSNIFNFTNDNKVDKKDFNTIPYTQALRIDQRNFYQILISVLAHEIDIIDIFYYKNPFDHISLSLSIYMFELCLDLTLNCLSYTDDVVSQKYNNNGSIKFFTSLSLSFMSNIFAGIISFIVAKLANYTESIEYIIKNVVYKKHYLLNMIKFKKYITIKLTLFYLVQLIINLCMFYYLIIFCTVYHKTQGSIMINYIIGISESMAISLGLSIITSLMRLLSIKYKWKSIYYTSKYFFENF